MRSSLHLLYVVPLGALIACSATHSGATTGTGGSGTGASPATSSGQPSGSGGAGTGGGGIGGLNLTGSGGAASAGCSADLRSITDADGNTLSTCPSDQGCFGGQCVAACSAASQSKGTIGCDFYAPDPPFYANGQSPEFYGPCYAVFVANDWTRPAQITVSRGGQNFDVTQFGYTVQGIAPNTQYTKIPSSGLPPNEVAVLFLSHQPGVANGGNTLECPVPPALLTDAAVEGSGTGSAFHVTSDTPITAYDILPYGGASSYLPSASLLFPSTAWGTNYYAVAPRNDGSGQLWALLVGTADNTMVTIAAAQTLPGGGGVPDATQGQSVNFTINAGQILQWIGGDPTSTVIQSTSPVGLFTGNTYLRVSSNTSPGGGGEDSAHQEIPQINALGSQYVGPGIETRLASLQPESVPYRIMGVVDGTTLTWDPAPPSSAPSTLNAGQMLEFETTSLFTVSSQDADHPFSLTQYMPGTPSGGTRDGCGAFNQGDGCGLGDEEWVNLLAPKQFLSHYVFFTDPTYATTNLVVTRVKGASGFADVTIDCLNGPITGWTPVDTEDTFEVADVDLVRGTVPVDNCNGSRHEANSTGAFGVMVWGTDWYSSYAYPAGGNIGSINTITVPPVPQ